MNKALIYLTVVSSYVSATVFSINLGFMQISLFRILVLFLPVACFSKLVFNYQIHGYLFSPDRKNNYSVLFMLFWLFYSLLSILWSPSVGEALRHSYFIACGVISIITFYLIIDDVKDIYYCLFASTLMIFIHGIIGWREIFTGNYVEETERTIAYTIQMLPVSTMFNVNDYATSMAIGVFTAFAVWKTTPSKTISIFAFFVMVSSALIVIWSRSRANIYGFALAVLVLLLLSGKKIFKNITLILILSFTLLFISDLFFPWITELFTDSVLTGITGINLEDGSDYTRMNLIKNGLHFLPQNLFLGTGAGGIEHWMSSEWIYDTGGITNIHNWWMEILAGYGIFVFLGYLFFFGKLCFDMYKIYRTSNNVKEVYISLAMIGALVSFIIGSVSSSSNMSSYSIWIFFAIAVAFQGIGTKATTGNPTLD